MISSAENPPRLGDMGSRAIITVLPDASLRQAVALMDEKRISCLVVVDAERPVGILTERDLVRSITREAVFGEGSVSRFMSYPPITASKDMPYLEGYHLCAEHGIRHLILVDEKGLLAGIVTETDFMEHLGLDAYVELKPVSSVMTRCPFTLAEGRSLRDALDLMSTHNISCVVALRDGMPAGILSERDVVHLSQTIRDPAACLLAQVMSTPIVTIVAEETLHKASNLMRKRSIRRLVVVDQSGSLAGIVTEHDLVKGLESRYTTFLRQIIARQTKELSRTKQRLSESLVLEHILRASLDMAIVATDTTGAVRYYNPAAESVFGIESHDAIGTPLEYLCNVAGLDAGCFETSTPEARSSAGRAFLLEKQAPEGNRALRCRIATIRDSDEQVLGFVHTLSDISASKKAEEERERLEAELLQARKMEAIGQLTGGIAHDFNNILAIVLGYACLALDSESVESGGEVEECLVEIRKAGQRAQDLVKQLLTFSRSSPLHRRRVDLAALIEEITRMLRATLPATLSLKLALNRDAPAVFVDPVQIQQLLMNLLLNARDAIEGHGTIVVGLRSLSEIDAVSPVTHRVIQGDWVELSVADTGCGMAAGILEQAFEPFFTTKEVGKGSGMGLAVAHGIVTQNGGEILVDSSPGNGTRFRILLEPSDSNEPDPEPPAGPECTSHSRDRGLHVLVVDDDPSVATPLGKLLNKQGYISTVVTDAQDALDLFLSSPDFFDILITDQVMPGLTGRALATRMRDRKPRLPIIILTGIADSISSRIPLRGGPIVVLQKPVESEELWDVMCRLSEDARETVH